MELYHFAWSDFCSWYLELRKAQIHGEDSPQKRSAVGSCLRVLSDITLLLNPFMPALTEELRSHLGLPEAITSTWPVVEAASIDDGAEKAFARLIAVVEGIRALRGRYQIAPAKELSVTLRCESEAVRQELSGNLAALETLAVAQVALQVGGEKPAFSGTEIVPGVQVHVALEGILDKAAEVARLSKELGEAEKFVASIEKKLSNESFVARAKPEVVEAEREKLESQKVRAAQLQEALSGLQD